MTRELHVMTVEEAGKRLRIGRGAAYLAVHRGEIPAVRIGRRLRVPVAAFERMLSEANLPEREADEQS
jgi:excisionase family DNA binding protein